MAHRRRYATFVVLFFLQCLESAVSVGTGDLHPCRQQRPSVKTGKSFVVGFAFLANGDESEVEWGSLEDGLHPCSAEDRETLMSSNITVSYFTVEVDKLTLLDSVHQLQEHFTGDFNNITVIAFSGGYRSKAKVVSVRDRDTDVWRVIRSLALIADFAENGLEQLQWYDLECGECQRTDRCLRFEEQTSCAWDCNSSNTTACRSEIYISFDGVDKNNEVLNSASQIRRLRRASVSHVYESGRDLATSTVV